VCLLLIFTDSIVQVWLDTIRVLLIWFFFLDEFLTVSVGQLFEKHAFGRLASVYVRIDDCKLIAVV
jgi:hypothetical protein